MKAGIRALVLDGSLNPSLAIVRSLGRAGAQVTVGDARRLAPAGLSRYARRSLVYPDPARDRDRFVDFLRDHLSRNRYDVVLPASDFTVVPVAEHRPELEGFARLAVSPLDQIRTANDKWLTVEAARRCGVPCPETHLPRSHEELEALRETLRYPVVVKPRSKVTWEGAASRVHKVTARNFVSSPADLIAVYDDVHARSPRPLIQEVVQGEGIGFFAIMAKGRSVAVFGHRRLREYPVSGGTSTCRESFLDNRLEFLGLRLLEALNWDGVAMVEFKRDRRDGDYRLMEINGRWWGSLPLAVASGVDFPRLYVDYLLDGSAEPVPTTFPMGVQCRALIPWDLLWLGARMTRPGRLRAIADFLSPGGLRFDVLSLTDPAPTIGAVVRTAGYALDVLRGRLTLSGESAPGGGGSSGP